MYGSVFIFPVAHPYKKKSWGPIHTSKYEFEHTWLRLHVGLFFKFPNQNSKAKSGQNCKFDMNVFEDWQKLVGVSFSQQVSYTFVNKVIRIKNYNDLKVLKVSVTYRFQLESFLKKVCLMQMVWPHDEWRWGGLLTQPSPRSAFADVAPSAYLHFRESF